MYDIDINQYYFCCIHLYHQFLSIISHYLSRYKIFDSFAATTISANAIAITMYISSSDIFTIASNCSPVSLSSDTLAHLSKNLLSSRFVWLFEEAMESTTWKLTTQG